MAAANAHRVVAELTIDVSRNGREGLVDGVERVLGSVDGVTAVEGVRVHGIRPDLNALSADVTVELVAGDRDLDDALRERYAIREIHAIDRG